MGSHPLSWKGLGAAGVTPPIPERLPRGLGCMLGSQCLWSPHASLGMGTAAECSAVSLRTLACARDQLEASAGVCSRQMALSDLAPGNCARHATLGGTAEAWAPGVALGANLVGPTANRRVGGLTARPPPTPPIPGFYGRTVQLNGHSRAHSDSLGLS